MVNSKMLQTEMKNHGYTIEKLAAELGKSRTCIFNKIHNKSEFKLGEIDSISRLLKLNRTKSVQIFFTD